MGWTTAEKFDTQTGRMQRLSGGSLRLLGASGQIVGQVTFNTPAGVVVDDLITLSGFPKSASVGVTGVPIASAAAVDAGGTVRRTFTVGLPGSGAEVIVSKLSGNPGDLISVAAPFTLRHAA